jgi:8-oxo-dGTP pyrophosphatase MutT (NUDIX family)
MNHVQITETQVSAGGVAFRRHEGQVEVALILVGPRARWQLPKGAINENEQIQEAALREVREETGIAAALIEPLDRIEYWFYATRDGKRIRFHKFVHFFLMEYLSGSVENHDHEAEEARWVEIGEALNMLAYESERAVMRKAHQRILGRPAG